MNLLFHAVDDTLKEFLNDPRYLGASPGMLMAFHSWGRDMSIHPHIHCLVTDGGLNHKGHWQRPRRSHFLPVKPLMMAFRGRLSALIHRALDNEGLIAPGGDIRGWHRLISRCQSKKWNVRLERRYSHAKGMAIYLARYARGGPINNGQITLVNSQVRFRYHDHRLNAGKSKSNSKSSFLTFTTSQFFKRYLQHVPEKRKQVIRCYGLYAPRARDRLNVARQLHHQLPLVESDYLDWETFMQKITGEDYRHCPECHRELHCSALIPKQQGPPLVT